MSGACLSTAAFRVHGALSRGAFAVVVLVSFAVLFAPGDDVPLAPPGVDKVVHAALFTAWILLFIAQTTLVAAHRVDIHRRLGILGAVLAPAIVVLGVSVSIHGGRTGWKPVPPMR